MMEKPLKIRLLEYKLKKSNERFWRSRLRMAIIVSAFEWFWLGFSFLITGWFSYATFIVADVWSAWLVIIVYIVYFRKR